MRDLLPCPFCGGDADLDWWWNEASDGGRGKVICIDCGTEVSGPDFGRPVTSAKKTASKADAADAWNRRAVPAVQPAHVSETPKSEHVPGVMLTPATGDA